jgi:hypothetical protein
MSALPPKADIGTGPRYQLRRDNSGVDIRRNPPRLWKSVDCRARNRSARWFGYRISAASFREMGSANFTVSSYTGWPHSLDSEARQFGDVHRNPPRLILAEQLHCRFAGRLHPRNR